MFQLWKGFAQRRKTREERQNEMMFIGMVAPPLPIKLKQQPQNQVVLRQPSRFVAYVTWARDCVLLCVYTCTRRACC